MPTQKHDQPTRQTEPSSTVRDDRDAARKKDADETLHQDGSSRRDSAGRVSASGGFRQSRKGSEYALQRWKEQSPWDEPFYAGGRAGVTGSSSSLKGRSQAE